MNEEEKEAIDILKRTIKYSNYCDSIGIGQIETLLNLIDKLQKENEELKEENDNLRDTNKILYEIGKQNAIQELLNGNWVSKNKIRTKIKELKEDEEFYREQDRMYEFNSKIKMLEELLDE